jgi:hypothetical protein
VCFGIKDRAAPLSVLGFVLRRAKIYLRDSPAFINGNGGGARAHGALRDGRVIFDEGTDISSAGRTGTQLAG